MNSNVGRLVKIGILALKKKFIIYYCHYIHVFSKEIRMHIIMFYYENNVIYRQKI